MFKIGITAGIFPPATSRKVYSKKQLCYLETELAQFWYQQGAIPILIPDLPLKDLSRFLQELDGLCLQGGTDISPQQYTSDFNREWLGDPVRDAYEFPILDWFIQNNKPVLGICRGFQLLNVYFGGTLYQDLPTQFNGTIIHQDKEKYEQQLHPLLISKGELFEQLAVAKDSNLVNSIHHQGIQTLGNNLVVLARSLDNLIEAFYHANFPAGKVMGIQWHPEFDRHLQVPLINSSAIVQHFLTFCKKD